MGESLCIWKKCLWVFIFLGPLVTLSSKKYQKKPTLRKCCLRVEDILRRLGGPEHGPNPFCSRPFSLTLKTQISCLDLYLFHIVSFYSCTCGSDIT